MGKGRVFFFFKELLLLRKRLFNLKLLGKGGKLFLRLLSRLVLNYGVFFGLKFEGRRKKAGRDFVGLLDVDRVEVLLLPIGVLVVDDHFLPFHLHFRGPL